MPNTHFQILTDFKSIKKHLRDLVGNEPLSTLQQIFQRRNQYFKRQKPKGRKRLLFHIKINFRNRIQAGRKRPGSSLEPRGVWKDFVGQTEPVFNVVKKSVPRVDTD